MPHVGPYDGRKARRKRCDACVQRKIKCRDGIPCENCKRTGRVCAAPAKRTSFTPVFVEEALTTKVERKVTSSGKKKSSILVPSPMSLKGVDLDILYFFTSFMPMNVFVNGKLPITQELMDMVKISPASRDAIQAVAIQHRGQQCPRDMAKPCRLEALQAYGRSVRSMQSQIASVTFLEDPSALWTTFFLGLFEVCILPELLSDTFLDSWAQLMRDSTGANWLSHFLQGTCTILRLQHPESLLSSGACNKQRRVFFLATRIFEIARSFVYSSPSFLSDSEWVYALERLWQNEGAALWHPKEALFDLLPQISDLSIRAIKFCASAKQFSPESQYAMSASFAAEGLLLQERLQQWLVETAAWEYTTSNGSSQADKSDNELLIGYIYYHAVKIYLSGTFDYHEHWSWPGAPCAPVLSRGQIDCHVSETLRLAQALLGQGTSGILLFFPLRVAGARAIDAPSRREIMDLLHTTATRGFVVAEAFKVDLSELWAAPDLYHM